VHIILTEDNAKHLREKYIVLELDLVRLEENADPVPAFCVVSFDDVSVDDILHIERYQALHGKLIENYRNRNWDFCEQALEHLSGKWKGTVDTFYLEMMKRIAKYKNNDPGEDWDPAIQKF